MVEHLLEPGSLFSEFSTGFSVFYNQLSNIGKICESGKFLFKNQKPENITCKEISWTQYARKVLEVGTQNTFTSIYQIHFSFEVKPT